MLLCLLLICSLSGWPQATFKGYVRNLTKDEAVPYVLVKNERSGVVVTGNEKGYFSIEAAPKDKLSFSRLGIEKKGMVVTAEMLQSTQRVYITFATDELEEVDVNGLTAYQRDSIARFELYKPTLTRKKDKLKIYASPIGIGFKNPFSSWLQYIVPKTKRKLKFKKDFAAWETEKFVASVYTPELVQELTGLKGEELAVFMNAYPMPATFARESGTLARKSWIKANYLDWQQKH